jgi:opacity protein-like surface antigen
MRKQLLNGAAAIAITTAIGGTGLAADLPLKAARPQAVLPPPLTWTGFYIGGHLGWGNAKFGGLVDAEDGIEAINHKPRGLVGGMQAGWNWQMNMFVFGLEGDASAAGIGKTFTQPGICVSDDSPDNTCYRTDVQLLASLRGRLGLAFNDWHVYATGGIGWTRANAVVAFGTTAFGSAKLSATGPVFGGGVEWKPRPHFSVRLEGLWYNFDKSISVLNHDGTRTATVELKDVVVVRFGANYHFNP